MDGANGVRAARCGGLARVGDGGRTLWAGGGGLRAERARRGGEWWVGWRRRAGDGVWQAGDGGGRRWRLEAGGESRGACVGVRRCGGSG